MKNRCKHEIIADILKLCNKKEATVTEIVKECSLAGIQAKYFLSLLTENGLLIRTKLKHSRAITHRTTEKGKEYLKKLEQLTSILPS